MWVWILSSIPLMYVSIPPPIPQCPENHGYIIYLNLGDSYSYTSYFFVKIILAILGPAHFYIIFRINLSRATKKLAGILIEMALNGKTIWCDWHLYVESWTQDSFPFFFRSSLISFISILLFLAYRSCTCFKFILNFFMYFGATVNGIVLLILVSLCLF